LVNKLIPRQSAGQPGNLQVVPEGKVANDKVIQTTSEMPTNNLTVNSPSGLEYGFEPLDKVPAQLVNLTQAGPGSTDLAIRNKCRDLVRTDNTGSATGQVPPYTLTAKKLDPSDLAQQPGLGPDDVYQLITSKYYPDPDSLSRSATANLRESVVKNSITQHGSKSYTFRRVDTGSIGGRQNIIQLDSFGVISHTYAGACGAGKDAFGAIFGPQVFSVPFKVEQSNEIGISFDWAAQAATGGDDYEVYGFLVKLSNDPNGNLDDFTNDLIGSGSSHTLLFHSRGKNQDWVTQAADINEVGIYRFRFINGSYDATGGTVLGATMYLSPKVIVGKKNAISFSTPPNVGANPSVRTYSISATTISKAPVTFVSTTTSVCTVSAGTTDSNTGTTTTQVTVLANTSGTTRVCTISASSGATSTHISAETVVRSFSVVPPGPPSKLEINRQPVVGASGVMTQTPIVEIQDANGYTTTSSGMVTATILSPTSSGSLFNGSTPAPGGVSVNAVNGVATFSNLSLAGLVGTPYVLQFTTNLSPSVTPATADGTAPTAPGLPTQLLLTTAPVLGASGANMTAQPVLEVRDSGGNLVPIPSSTVAVEILAASGTGGTLNGTRSVSAASGTAVFTDLSLLGLLTQTYTLRFTYTSTSPAVTLTFDATGLQPSGPGSATQLVFATAPAAGASGANMTQPVAERSIRCG
jgi:hypothetical protein